MFTNGFIKELSYFKNVNKSNVTNPRWFLDDFQNVLAMQKFQRLQGLLVKMIAIQELYKINIISIPKSLQLLRLFELNFFIASHHSKQLTEMNKYQN